MSMPTSYGSRILIGPISHRSSMNGRWSDFCKESINRAVASGRAAARRADPAAQQSASSGGDALQPTTVCDSTPISGRRCTPRRIPNRAPAAVGAPDLLQQRAEDSQYVVDGFRCLAAEVMLQPLNVLRRDPSSLV